MDAQCSYRTSQVLQSLPGFEGLPVTWFPNNLRVAFGVLDGVSEIALHEYDDADKALALREYRS